jgi:hypothetical protein
MLPIDRQTALIEAQILEWQEVAFNAEIAHRVHTRLKSPPEVLQSFVARMTQAEQAIAVLHDLLDEVRSNVQP